MRARDASVALRTANANNSAILRALPDLLFEVDGDGLRIAFHSARTDLLVVPVEDNIGKTIEQVLTACAKAYERPTWWRVRINEHLRTWRSPAWEVTNSPL